MTARLAGGLPDQFADDGRVVLLSSAAHFRPYPEGIRFDDLGAEKHDSPWGAYGQIKLANLLFARELLTQVFDRPLTGASTLPRYLPSPSRNQPRAR